MPQHGCSHNTYGDQQKWCSKLALICTTPIIPLLCPPKFCITFVVNSFWVLQLPQEKLKTMIILLFCFVFFFLVEGRGGQGVLWEMYKWHIRELLTSKFLGKNRKKLMYCIWQHVLSIHFKDITQQEGYIPITLSR